MCDVRQSSECKSKYAGYLVLKMKRTRIRPFKLKSTIIGRNGKKYHVVPVTVTKKRVVSAEDVGELSRDSDANESFSSGVFGSKNTGLSSAQRRRINYNTNWEKVRQKLVERSVEDSFLPSGTKCVFSCGKEATVRCQNCGPRQYMCLGCAKEQHSVRNQFHLLDQWKVKGDMYIPLYPDHGVVGCSDHTCATKFTRLFTLIDSSGIKHKKRVEVCSCEPDAVKLIKCNFWPGSPSKPCVGIHMDFMNLVLKLFLQSQVSLHDFAEVINALQPQLGLKTLNSVYSVLNSGCFEEFRYFKYQLQYLGKFCPGLYNGASCPLCPKDEGVSIECMDACMGLARKKTKGSELTQPKHSTLIFSDQNDVDNFVDNYGKDGEKMTQNCSRFHAGEVLTSLRSKGKNKLFDEKGVFGRVCRHDFPKSFVNLKYGERISYSVYEIKKIQESVVDKPNVKIEYSPRRIKGIGLTDGEGVERLWSYLRGYSAMTKEMGSEKRTDVLTDALLFYGQKLYLKFGSSLKDKLCRAQELSGELATKLKNISKALQITCTPDVINTWKELEFGAIKPKETDLELQWDEQYVDVLMEIQKIRNDFVYMGIDDQQLKVMQNKLKRKEKEQMAIEKKHGIRKSWKEGDAHFDNAKSLLMTKKRKTLMLDLHKLASERAFLLEMKKKYADGQSIAIKLTSQLSKLSDSMKKCLCTLNALSDTGHALNFEDVKDPESPCFSEHNVSETVSVPLSKMKEIISISLLHDRSLEEQAIVKIEMIRLIHFIFSQIQLIDYYLATLQDAKFDQGLKALLLAKKSIFQSEHSVLEKQWEGLLVSPYIAEECRWYTSCSELVEDHVGLVNISLRESQDDMEINDLDLDHSNSFEDDDGDYNDLNDYDNDFDDHDDDYDDDF